MIGPTIVALILLALIGVGAPIFLALGAAGLTGLFMARGSMAFFFAPSSFFGPLNSFELIALPLFILMDDFLSATPVSANLFRAPAMWLQWLRGGPAIATVGALAIFGAISGVMAWYDGHQKLQAAEYGERVSSSFGTPMVIPFSMRLIGFSILALQFLLEIFGLGPRSSNPGGATPV